MKKKYDFIANVEKIIKDKEDKSRNLAIGFLIFSLQQPMKDVVNLTIKNQVQNVQKLIKQVYGK